MVAARDSGRFEEICIEHGEALVALKAAYTAMDGKQDETLRLVRSLAESIDGAPSNPRGGLAGRLQWCEDRVSLLSFAVGGTIVAITGLFWEKVKGIF